MKMSSEPETEAKTQAENEVLRKEIELRAYFKYSGRGCEAGHDVDDWLAAEREILTEGAAAEHAETPETPPEEPHREQTRDHSSGLRAQGRGPNRSARARA
jgi:hypothetical protein